MSHGFNPKDDLWLVWTRGLRHPVAYIGASAPGKPLFQTKTEKASSLAKHLLKESEKELSLEALANVYPPPKETADA